MNERRIRQEENKNFLVRTVEDNNTVRLAGVMVMTLSLMDFLIKASDATPSDRLIIMAAAVAGYLAVCLGEGDS